LLPLARVQTARSYGDCFLSKVIPSVPILLEGLQNVKSSKVSGVRCQVSGILILRN
jgi:hypothetical protein